MQFTNSTKALELMWFAFMTNGVYPKKTYKFYEKLHAAFTIIVANTIYVSGFVIQLFFVENSQQLLANLPMNICIVMCSVKFFFLLRMRMQLIEVNELFTELDSRHFTPKQESRLLGVIRFCKILSVGTFITYYTVNTIPAIVAALSGGQKLVFEMWFPYDWKSSMLLFWITISIQYFFQMYVATQNVANDVSGPAYLSVLGFHLSVIMERIELLHYDKKKTEAETRKEFIECIKDHRIVMKIFDTLQDSVSYTIFFQFVASALVLCTSALMFLFYDLSLGEMFAVGSFLFCEIVQIFPCCYCSNNFMVITDQTVTSIYSMNWMDLSTDFQKSIVIFMQMTQASKVIIAGKQIPITLRTFVSVMKLTYSLIALVAQM